MLFIAFALLCTVAQAQNSTKYARFVELQDAMNALEDARTQHTRSEWRHTQTLDELRISHHDAMMFMSRWDEQRHSRHELFLEMTGLLSCTGAFLETTAELSRNYISVQDAQRRWLTAQEMYVDNHGP